MDESLESHDFDAKALADAIAQAPDAQAAMQVAVARFKAELPHYSWVGIYLLEATSSCSGRTSASRHRTRGFR